MQDLQQVMKELLETEESKQQGDAITDTLSLISKLMKWGFK